MSDSNEEDRQDIATNTELLKKYLGITQGELITELTRIRDERRRLRELDKILIEEWRAAESAMISVLDNQGALRVSTAEGTAAITEDDVPLVRDWDECLKDLRETDRLYLLQRRIATAAWRELKDNGIDIPGVEVYKKRSISLRKK